MKIGKYVLFLSVPFLLLSCGGKPEASDPGSSQKESETSSKTETNPPTSSSTNPGSSSNLESSESKTSAEPIESSSEEPISSQSEIEPAEDLKDYVIFDKAPEIHFTTEEGADLKWATTPNKNTDKPKVNGTISTANCDEAYLVEDLAATMKVRGNYTSNYVKKPFQIAFDSKQNLFGLNKGNKFKKWVLLADVKDPSMMRNALAFYLGDTLMEDYFCPTFTPVHLYLNDSYWGMYLLTDNKEVGKGRVNISEPEKNYTGTVIGYFFEYDCYWTEEAAKEDGDPTFEFSNADYIPQKITTRAQGQESDSTGYTISSKIYDDAQIAFLKNHLKNCYTVIYNAVFNNKLQEIAVNEGVETLVDSEETDPAVALGKTIDINSFVNMYIMSEICCDADIAHSSFYLSLDMAPEANHLLTLTCPWDWDSSLGLKKGVVENASEMFASRSSNPWVSMLTNSKWFMEKVQARWSSLYNKGFFTKALRMID